MNSAKRKVSDAGNQFLDQNGRYTVAGLRSDLFQRAILSTGHIAAEDFGRILEQIIS